MECSKNHEVLSNTVSKVCYYDNVFLSRHVRALEWIYTL